MKQNKELLPLCSFFESLRKHDFDLGLDEYYLLIKALKGGFGLESEASLLFLCKKLWLKTKEREELFEKLFEKEFQKEKQLILQLRDKKEAKISDKADKEKKKEEEKRDEPKPDKKADKVEDLIKKEEEAEIVEEERITLSIEDVKADSAKEVHRQKAESISGHKFILKGSYLTQSENQLKHAWRFLRKNEYEGFTDELNIKETIKVIIKEGILHVPVFMPAKKNKATLITLIDHGGSMAAFGQLAQTIAETSSKGGMVANTTYYFYNIPHQRLYKNMGHTLAEKIEVVLAELEKRDSAILVISDAGAARGRFNPKRVELTKHFVEEIKLRTHRIAWINPMPEKRWENTSAHYIKDFVPMFEATEIEINSAVKVLRGKLRARQLFLKQYELVK